MSDLRLPCRESDTPEDWFISRDGKQYGDDDLLSQEQRDAIAEEVERERGCGPHLAEQIDEAIDIAEAGAKKAALARRRKARDACHNDCVLFRTRCLGMALDQGIEHGTWGGYYEEELRTLRREIARRKRGTEPRS